MTSKALEAAIKVANQFWPEVLPAEMVDVIRAFVDNLSEEAAEAGSNAAAQTLINSVRSGQATLNAAERAGIRAAIAKDLE